MSIFWQIFDIQMAIFRRVRAVPVELGEPAPVFGIPPADTVGLLWFRAGPGFGLAPEPFEADPGSIEGMSSYT